jgi:hypothetical protein
VQCFAALSEELRENLGVGLRRHRHSRVIRFDLRYADKGCTATLATRMGVFALSGVVLIAGHPMGIIMLSSR